MAIDGINRHFCHSKKIGKEINRSCCFETIFVVTFAFFFQRFYLCFKAMIFWNSIRPWNNWVIPNTCIQNYLYINVKITVCFMLHDCILIHVLIIVLTGRVEFYLYRIMDFYCILCSNMTIFIILHN